jgi:hypothetical protein
VWDGIFWNLHQSTTPILDCTWMEKNVEVIILVLVNLTTMNLVQGVGMLSYGLMLEISKPRKLLEFELIKFMF